MIVVAVGRMTSSSIYGDGVLFSEDIREVFAMPHREEYCIHMFCRAGSASIGMNYEDIVLRTYECLICQPKSVVRYCEPTKNFCCFIVSVQQQAHREILDYVLRYEQDYYAKRMFIIHHPVLSLSPYLRQRACYYAALFKQIISPPPHTHTHTTPQSRLYQRKLADTLCIAVYTELLYTEEHERLKTEISNKTISPTADGNRQTIYYRFTRLVSQYGAQHHRIAWYAQALQISPKYLTSVCMQVCGCSPAEIINNWVLMELKRLLTDKEQTLSAIAEQLHFSSPNNMIKFFRAHIGITPTAYRQSILL